MVDMSSVIPLLMWSYKADFYRNAYAYPCAGL